MLTTLQVQAQNKDFTLGPHTERLSLDAQMDVYREKGDTLILEDLRRCETCFRPLQAPLNGGYTRDTFWLKFTLSRTDAAPTKWWLEIGPSVLDNITVYVLSLTDDDPIVVYKGGDTLPYYDRWADYRNFVFPIDLPDTRPHTIYIRMQSTGLGVLTATLWAPNRLLSFVNNESAVFGLYYGIWIAVLAGNLIYWIIYQVRGHHWWLLYLVADVFQTLSANGLAFKYLTPSWPVITQFIPGVSLAVALSASCYLLIYIFELESTNPRLKKVLKVVSAGALLASIGIFLGYYVTIAPIMQAAGMAILTTGLVLSAVRVAREGKRYSRYLYAFGLMEVSLSLIFARNLGLLPPSYLVNNLWQANLLVHVLLINFGIGSSLSESRRSSRQAKQALALAEQQQNFVAFFTHELRAPLGNIGAIMSNLMRNSTNHSPEIRRKHGNILQIVRRITMLVENYMTNGQLAHGTLKLNRISFELASFISSSLNQPVYRRCTVDFSRVTSALHVFADPHLLELACLNIVDNALKYSPDSEPVTISISTRPAEKMVDIRVSDRGQGIAEEDQGKISFPFYRSGAHAHIRGHGMGLWIVTQILELHGGSVHIESEINVGTTVMLSFPFQL